MNILTRTWTQNAPRADTSSSGAAFAPSATQRGLRLSIAEGALSTIHVNVTAGVFLTGFALLLGAGDFELGLLTALPFIGQLFQFVGAYLEEQLGERRRLVVLSAGISRSLWAIIALLPFLAGLGQARLAIFIVVLAVAQALLGIAGNAWTSWMSDLVPPNQRGRYFGVRNTVCSISAMISVWLAGRALDYYGGAPVGYALIFGVAVLGAVAGVLVLRRQPEPPMRRQERLRFSTLFSAPLRHRPFRELSLAATGWSIAIGVALPFFHAYAIQNLKLSFATLAIFAVITSAVTLVSQPLVGRLQDRYGDRPVLIVSVFGAIVLPLGWVIATPTFLAPLWLNVALSGVFWPGITQGLINMVMDRSPAEGRGAYVACYGALTGIATFVASLIGGVIASSLGAMVIELGPLTLDHYSILFVVSSVGRAIMAVVFARRL